MYRGVENTPKAPTRPISYTPGRQILFVYIGSETCGFSVQPGFREIVRTAQVKVAQQARANKQAFSSLGVSAGQSAILGIEYLEEFGPFDEVISGRGFLNMAAMRYFFDEYAGDASFPQILVIQRDLSYLEPGYTYRNERVLLRAVGVPQIEKWVEDNAPIS